VQLCTTQSDLVEAAAAAAADHLNPLHPFLSLNENVQHPQHQIFQP
jgi:hypothetical protein